MEHVIRSVIVDDGDNGLKINHIDEDGIQIVETEFGKETPNQVYIYNSEIKKLISALQKVSNNK